MTILRLAIMFGITVTLAAGLGGHLGRAAVGAFAEPGAEPAAEARP